MPLNIILFKVTDQGIKNIKGAPQRLEEAKKGFEAIGGKMLGFYAVMGEYDYVVIGDAPSDEAGMAFNLALGSKGNVSPPVA